MRVPSTAPRALQCAEATLARCACRLAASTLPPGAPVLILANKVDLPHAAQQEELYYGLGLDVRASCPARVR